MKRLASLTITVMATIGGVIIFWQFRQIVLILLLSVATGAAFRPLVDYLNQRKLSRNASLFLAYFLTLAAIIALLGLMSDSLVRDIEGLSNQITQAYNEIQSDWPYSNLAIHRLLAEQIPPPGAIFSDLTGAEGVQNLIGLTTNLSQVLASLVLIVILSLYWSADRAHFERIILSLIDVDRRPLARRLWMQIETGIGAYIRSEFVQSLIAGVVLWIGYLLLGIEYATLLAIAGAVVWLVPWFGAVIAILLPIVASLGAAIHLGFFAGIYTAVVLIVLEYYVEPRIYHLKNYSSVVLILVMILLTQIFGILGLLLAPLVSFVIQIVLGHIGPSAFGFVFEEPEIIPIEKFEDQTSELILRMARMRKLLDESGQSLSPEVMSLATRLEELVEATEQQLERRPEDGGIYQEA